MGDLHRESGGRVRQRRAWLLAATLILLGCGKPEPYRIGFVAGTSGRVADLGTAGRNAAILAVEQKNAAGGINGRPVELILRDDEQNPETAKRVFQELVDQKVEAVVGPMTSAMAVAMTPLADASHVLLVSPTVTSTDFSGKDDYFFRVIASTKAYATQSARFQRETLGVARFAAIYDVRNASYTESWLRDFRETFERMGGRVELVVPFRSGSDVHFADLARQLLAAKTQGIVIVANSVDTAQLCQQIRALDAKVGLVGAEWASTEKLIELGGKAVEGMYLSQFLDRDSDEQAYQVFRQAYRQRFNQEPGFAGVASFDATQVVMAGLEKRQNGQSLKEALLAQREFRGLQEKFSFDASGDTSRTVYKTVVRDGKFQKVGP